MRTKLILLLLLSSLLSSCSSLPLQMRSIADNNAKTYLEQAPKAEEHPNAGASMLYSYSYFELFPDGTSVNRIVERIKIFNERGRSHSSKTINYRERYQRVKMLYANTIRANGQVIKLSKNDIYDVSSYAGYEFYTDIRQIRFTMPAVEDGCIIEYAYEIKNLKPIIPFDFFANFFCQEFNPLGLDILEVVLPDSIELNYKQFNTSLAPEINRRKDKNIYIFTNRRQKEIIFEPRMPSILDKNTFPQLVLWTLKDWKIISQWYSKLAIEQSDPDIGIAEFTRQLIAGKNTKEEKINATFNFVAQQIRYISVLLGPHTHKPHPAADIFQKRYGDCKDKTTLLIAMLKIAGIEALPALVPSYPEYFDETIPSLMVFNHVIAVVPNGDGYYWLDATKETAAFDSVPFSRPTKVLLILPDGSYKFIVTPSPTDGRDYQRIHIKYELDTEGDAAIEAKYLYAGKAAESVRYLYKYLPPEQRLKYFERRGIAVTHLQFGSFTDARQPFTINLKGSLKNLAQKLDENLMVLSDIVRMETYKDITAAPQRNYPINLKSSFYAEEDIQIALPLGFRIRKLPDDFHFKEPFLARREEYSYKNKLLSVHVAQKHFEHTVVLDSLDNFKQLAQLLQKHHSTVKNIIMEKK